MPHGCDHGCMVSPQHRRPPGPRGAAAAATFAALLSRPLATMVRLNGRYGEAASMPMGARRYFYLLTRPEHAEHVLAAHQDRYVKAITYRLLEPLLGAGLVTSEGEVWRRHRRLIQPVFARRHVTSFAPLMVAEARRVVDRWDSLPDGAVLNAAAEMNGLTLSVVGRALFGADLTEEARRVAHSMAVLQRASVNPALFPLMWTPNLASSVVSHAPRYGRAVKTVDGVVRRIIAGRRAAPPSEEPRDLLDLLLAARDEDGTALNDAEVRDEVATFVLAGHETTSNALTWSLALLSAVPATRARLEDEVDAVLGDRRPGELDAADLDKLPWTQAVVSEAMRLYPPAWTIEREAVSDDEVCGISVPAGTTVAVPPYLVHRHPETWPNPEGFDPERFLPDRAAGRHRYAHIPFGGGRRGCVGAGFATLEATLVLAALTQRHRLDLAPGRWPRIEPHVTLRPKGGLPMMVYRRR